MKKIDKFKVAPGFMLFVQKQEEQYYLRWSHISDVSLIRDWPHGDDKIKMPVIDEEHAYLVIFMLAGMFGHCGIKNVSKDYPMTELVVEFI